MKKIMLHGATDLGSSNYGDYIYGEMIYNYLSKKGYEVCFYNPSDFFRKFLPKYTENRDFHKKEADMIVYIPGGYFGEGHNARFRDNLIQFLRFMPLGIWAANKKKPLAVIGVGAGPNHNKLMNFGIKKICNWAKIVTVRDNFSYKSLKKLCPNASIVECGDLITTSKLPERRTQQIDHIVKTSQSKKIFLVHYNHEKIALLKFAKCAKKFIENHPDFHVVVASDSILDMDDSLFQEFKEIYGRECSHFKYNDPHEMTALIKKVDIVLTCKLHVGVVATTLGKSVIAAACHPEKTKRYYHQIDEDERCVNLYKISEEELCILLEKKGLKNIKIGAEIINKASLSWEYLDGFLRENNG